MDKLVQARQGEIRKMSDVRLQNMLAHAGVTVEDLKGMDRMAMLNKHVELVLAEKEPVTSKPAAALVMRKRCWNSN